MLLLQSTSARVAPSRRTVSAHIELCGTLVAEIDGRHVERALPGPKGRQLFACLVIGRQRLMSRDELIDVVWPLKPPADPDGAFSTLLTRVRAAVGADLIVGRHELRLDLGEEPWVDWDAARDGVAAAEAMLAAGDAAGAFDLASSALEITRHPLLPGLSTPWVEQRRRELDELRSALLETCGRAALGAGGERLPTAERSARELIEREPYRETGYGLLMETHAARGNIAEALRVYDDLRRLLREELGLTPAPPLRALADRLLERHDPGPRQPSALATGESTSPTPLPATICAVAGRPLAGRDGELEQLLSAVLQMPADRCRVLLVTGAAGVGKTRLAAEVAARAHARGCEVLHGRAQRVTVVPYQPFLEALRRHLGHGDALARELAPLLRPELAELARLVPELRQAVAVAHDDGSGDPGLRARRICDAVAALCGALAARRPLLLLVDDLQWADAATLLLLRHVATGADGARVTVLATLRDDAPLSQDLRDLLLDLLRDRLLECTVLRALDEAETAELVAAHRGSCPHDQLRAIHATARGNPFLIEEALRCDGASACTQVALQAAGDHRCERECRLAAVAG